MVSQRRGDRAQLIILGCIALAFVIISLGLLVNTTIYTESSSQALSNAQVDSAMSLDLETRRGSRSLIHRVNLGPRDRNEDALNDSVISTVDNYSVLLGEHYARSRAASVDVNYSEDGSFVGTRVIQAGDGNFFGDFALDGDHTIGWFVVNTNVSETDQGSVNPFRLTVGNGSDTLAYEIYRNESTSGNEPNLTISSTLGSDQVNVTCDPRRNRVVLDVVTGNTIADSPCGSGDLHSISDLDPPHTVIEASETASFNGKWEFISNRSFDSGAVDADPAGGGFRRCDNPPTQPRNACSSPAVWTANVTTTFESDGASFYRNRNVSIYGGSR